MNLKKLIGLTALACAFAANADTLYVDINNPNAADDTAEGRGSEALPYKSIQAAVNAAEEDWTIKVNPGAYTNGTVTSRSRVCVNKRLTILSRQGKDVTHIVGVRSTKTTTGFGAGVVRGMFVTAAASGSRIEGFTFRDGATDNNKVADSSGGGWCVTSGANAYFVDCVVTNSVGFYAGGIMGGTAIRCLFKDNVSYSWNMPSAARWANLWNCVVYQNQSSTDAVMLQTTNVNVTVVYYTSNGSSAPSKLWGCDFRNSISVSYRAAEAFSNSDAGITEYNCVNSVTTTADGNTQLFDALGGDWRLLPTSAAVGKADAAYLTETFPLPADILADMRDYAGNKIDTTQPPNAGAIQTVGAVTCGKLKANEASYYVNGVYVPANYTWQPPKYPTFYSFKPAGYEQVVYASYGIDGSGVWRCQDTNGVITLCGSPDASKTSGLWYPGVSATIWVSQLRGSDDANADGSKDKPYASLQYAVDNSVLGSYDNQNVVMWVEQGDYATGGATAAGVNSRIAVTRSSNNLRMIAVDGPEKTIIRGGTDTRCTYHVGFVQGFTLTGANISGSTVTGSAAYYSSLVDCVVSNNVGGSSLQGGGSTYIGGGIRTKYVGNTVSGNLIEGSDGGANICFSYCLIAGNTIGNYVFWDNGTAAYNCTVVGNTIGKKVTANPTRLYNCIFCDSPSIDINGNCAGNVINRIASYGTLPASWTDEAVNFVDETAHDYRLTTLSSAVGQGYADLTSFDGSNYAFGQYYYKRLDHDLAGNLPEFQADGRTYAGCYQSAAATVMAAATISGQNGGLSLDGEPIGTASKTLLVESGSLTFTIGRASDATRPCAGFTVNGVTNLFDSLPDGTRTFTVDDPSKSVKIEAIYDSVWYVDAVNGNDANTGYTPKTAKRTLATACTNALLVAGDTILALPGVYNEGDVMHSATTFTRSRVVVPANVTIASADGPDVTFIEGARATAGVDEPSGCGSNATRCAYIRANGTLKGFTLINGCTSLKWFSKTDDWAGGGACGADIGAARLVDCVVSNCQSCSGVIRSLSSYRCRIADIDAEWRTAFPRSSPGPAVCNMYNCFIARIRGTYQVEDCYEVVNCTIIGDNASGKAVDGSNSSLKFYNCLIDGKAHNCTFYRCILTTNVLDSVKPGYQYALDDTSFVDKADVPYDAFGRSLKGSEAIDAANPEYQTKIAVDPDLDGEKCQRVYNGTMDVGAYEYDWRKDYAAQLGCRTKITVDEASPTIVSETDGVRLAAGTALTFGLQKSSFIECDVTVDAGTVGVYVNGELNRTLNVGEQAFRICLLKPGDKIRLDCSAGGSALVKSAQTRLGMVMIFR